YDNRLHTLIVVKCDNDRLKYFVKILNQQILRYQFLAAKALDNANETIQQHFQIIDLLKKKDLTGLTKLLKEHLESSAQYILDRNILQ
ncbi:MAG: FCD domain-containing protein, partial [Dethiobacteria bacterium]|nr:FCD domain-containing protein [Dethiobacteria bacterium]